MSNLKLAKIKITGPAGCGKTTLIKKILDAITESGDMAILRIEGTEGEVISVQETASGGFHMRGTVWLVTESLEATQPNGLTDRLTRRFNDGDGVPLKVNHDGKPTVSHTSLATGITTRRLAH